MVESGRYSESTRAYLSLLGLAVRVRSWTGIPTNVLASYPYTRLILY